MFQVNILCIFHYFRSKRYRMTALLAHFKPNDNNHSFILHKSLLILLKYDKFTLNSIEIKKNLRKNNIILFENK